MKSIVRMSAAVIVVFSLALAGCTKGASPSPSGNTSAELGTEKAGHSCEQIGIQVKISNSKYLECRYNRDLKMNFVQILEDKSAPLVETGLTDISVCKIQDQRPSNVGMGGQDGPIGAAFPLKNNQIPQNGVIKVAIAPIDFNDSPGSTPPLELVKEEIETAQKWLEFTTGGRVTYEWTVYPEWIRMPLDSPYYNWQHPYFGPDGNATTREGQLPQLQTSEAMGSQVFTEVDKVLPVDQYDYFWVMSPPTATAVEWGPQGTQREINITRGLFPISYTPIGTHLWDIHSEQVPLWATFLHEMMHAHGLAMHAPSNDVPLYIGNSIGTVMASWDSFLAGWRPDEVFACIDSATLGSIDISLTSIDLDDSGYKAAFIRLNDHQVVVVESRRKGPFSTGFVEGTAGVTAYLVDSSVVAQRFDGNPDRVKDYFAYMLDIDAPHPEYLDLGMSFRGLVHPFAKTAWKTIAFEGDSFTFDGLRISVTDSSTFDTVHIERVE